MPLIFKDARSLGSVLERGWKGRVLRRFEEGELGLLDAIE